MDSKEKYTRKEVLKTEGMLWINGALGLGKWRLRNGARGKEKGARVNWEK